MKKRYIGFLFLLLLLCPCFTVHTASAASPVAKWGRLQVKGTQIVSDKSAIKRSKYSRYCLVSPVCKQKFFCQYEADGGQYHSTGLLQRPGSRL